MFLVSHVTINKENKISDKSIKANLKSKDKTISKTVHNL
uniref:Uncharacterized protein n=1 Tax=Anguilla anguilla TaxID=7936 RepID=A0A0E9RUX4_ANGAN